MYSFLDQSGPVAFAHRGGAGEAPENTLAAFEIAVALGYEFLETDAHITRDGVVVAFHDERLDRVTDRTGAIAELGIADAYTYLPNSVRRFPGPLELAGEMERAGLTDITYVLTAGGIVAIHSGSVPAGERW